MDKIFADRLNDQLGALRRQGLYKAERVLDTPQQTIVGVADHPRREVINLCANNYLGLANHPEIIDAAISALEEHGYGMASVRFICGTQTVHKALEQRLSPQH